MPKFNKKRIQAIAVGLFITVMLGLATLHPFAPPNEKWAPIVGPPLPFIGWASFHSVWDFLGGAFLVFVLWVVFSRSLMFIDDPAPPHDP